MHVRLFKKTQIGNFHWLELQSYQIPQIGNQHERNPRWHVTRPNPYIPDDGRIQLSREHWHNRVGRTDAESTHHGEGRDEPLEIIAYQAYGHGTPAGNPREHHRQGEGPATTALEKD